MREVGGTVSLELRYLKRGTEDRGGDKKILKRGKVGTRDGCLKKKGAGTPLRIMLSWVDIEVLNLAKKWNTAKIL